jgi:uncharacterized protein YndB with AHSA1/START domain
VILDGTIRLEARGDASPDTVWDRYAEPAQWPRWSPQIRRVDVDGAREGLMPGMTGRVFSYGPLPVRFTVTAVHQEARTWSWAVDLGPLHLELDHSVAPADRADGRGSVAALTLRGPWPVLVAYAPLAQLALGRLVSP